MRSVDKHAIMLVIAMSCIFCLPLVVPIARKQKGYEVITTLIRPTNDQVILKALKEDRKTAGGIVLPDSTRESCALGVVFAVGRGTPVQGNASAFHAPDMRRGDEVFYYKNRTTPFRCEGEDMLLIKAEDVLVVITRAPDDPSESSPAE